MIFVYCLSPRAFLAFTFRGEFLTERLECAVKLAYNLLALAAFVSPWARWIITGSRDSASGAQQNDHAGNNAFTRQLIGALVSILRSKTLIATYLRVCLCLCLCLQHLMRSGTYGAQELVPFEAESEEAGVGVQVEVKSKILRTNLNAELAHAGLRTFQFIAELVCRYGRLSTV